MWNDLTFSSFRNWFILDWWYYHNYDQILMYYLKELSTASVKWKFIILMSDCVHTLSRIEYEWIRMNFLRWFSVFLLVPYSIISALLLILHSCISYVLSYQYTVFLGPIQKVQHSSLGYQYLFMRSKSRLPKW